MHCKWLKNASKNAWKCIQNINNFWKMLFFTDFFRLISCIRPVVIKQLQKRTCRPTQIPRKQPEENTLMVPVCRTLGTARSVAACNSFKIMNMKWVKCTRTTLHLMSSYTQQAGQMLPPVPDICCSVFSMSSLFSADLNSSFSRWSFHPILSTNTRGRTASFTDV